MDQSSQVGASAESAPQVLWEDGERVLCRGWRLDPDGNRSTVLEVRPAAQHPGPATLDRLAHEYALREELDAAWAARPLSLGQERGQTTLVMEDPGGELLATLLGQPMPLELFLRLAPGLAESLARLHQRGLIHKDVKPANILVNRTSGEVRLTGFGIASRLLRERQAPEPPEFIAGTLAYMAPEQTGRMNRSIDSRSDLYALGVTLYEMLTGTLPFTAADPMEWVHCHIARRPVPPTMRSRHVPLLVSGIVMKLLAKNAEERYQTATGVGRDLRRCLAEWDERGRIGDFPLGQQDTPGRVLIPEKLYGRAGDVETLLGVFDRVIKSGATELVLVAGYSGIGKSAVVHELHKALVPSRGLFAAGKFDQYKRDIPYATLAQAFQSLVRTLLSKSEAELGLWRDAFADALGPNGRLIVDLVPELKLVIGEPPPIPELPPQQAQARFQLVFRRFISVFARPDHPLALFLDDLQWLDAATLDLLEDLLVQPDLQYLMLIGAYRDNEVDGAHKLARKLQALRQAGARVQQIRLAPLARGDLAQMIMDALRCSPEDAAPLAQLVHDKTGGNPFFALQFISALLEEGLLRFDHDAASWRWDLNGIHAKGYTDNVVDLMVGKLTRLPAETQAALQQLACLGNVAEIAMLSMVLGKSNEDLRSDLWAAIRLELVEPCESSYKFIHDRIHEAAYSLIPERLRAETHLRIGRLLTVHTPVERRDQAIFEIVNQLNRGGALITAPDEREQLAEFNLLAGQRARATTAYASALTYLTTGAALLAEDPWERRRDLIFALELHRGECEFLTGDLVAAEQRLAALSSRAADTIARATVTCLRVDLYTALDQSSRAIAVGLDYLRHLGIDWSPHPTNAEARREYEQVWLQLGSRTIESLIDLPLMHDAASLATMDVLTRLGPPAFYTDTNLLALFACRAVNLSLERGNCDASCSAYVLLSMVAGPRFGDYRAAVYRFGQLGYDLLETRGLMRFQARTYMEFGYGVVPWTRHVRVGRDFVRRAFDAANKIGDLTYAAYCCDQINGNFLAAGDPLAETEREAQHGLAFAQKMQFGLVIDAIATQIGLIRTLRGLTPIFGCFDDGQFDERRIESRFAENPDLAFVEFWYWVRKLQARFFAGDYASAIEALSRAEPLLWTSVSQFETAEYHFYAALSRSAVCDSTVAHERERHLDATAAHHRQLQVWAANCPENFANRAALIGAEIARLEGREFDAARLYEQAIRSSRDNGFVHNEAVANELAARFYAAHGFEKIADTYLRDARYLYLRWGADGKVRQLDQLYPQLGEKEPAPGPTRTIGTPVEHLDLATVIKVSQAVSGEIVLEKTLDMLMRTSIEQAGAERGLLILAGAAGPRIEAEAITGGDAVIVHMRNDSVNPAVLPASLLHYVLRTREGVIFDDAATEPGFGADPYFREHAARSILCLPLITQAKLVGALYLENNLAPRVFAPARLAVLKLLASQAAIALENARLYRDLAEREARIRRLVDANIIGIFIWESEGNIIEANEAFLRMVGHDRADLLAGLRWTDLTPPEWRRHHEQSWTPELRMTGSLQPYEKEYFRKDGSRVPALVGAAAFDGTANQGVSFVIDLTERKQAEAKARESEARYREVQMELAHANRFATIGQLSASIAHEVRQPIAASITNAQAGLRWLGAQPPDLEEARRAFNGVVNSGVRANDIISRIRDLIKKAPPRKDRVDINDAIREVIAFTRGEAVKNGASVQTALADGLPLIEGDRVQLQQVVLNLVINAFQAMDAVADGPRDLFIVTARAEPNGVAIEVKDTGPGLTTTALEHLFVPFYTTKPGGLGMGLSICRSIVEAHGGRLWAEANVPCGAVFRFMVTGQPGGASQ